LTGRHAIIQLANTPMPEQESRHPRRIRNRFFTILMGDFVSLAQLKLAVRPRSFACLALS
jgi:hypothetical protein